MAINLETFNSCRVLVIGDLMIDEYVWGVAERISPEAPVQVVSVRREDYTLGGAGNVAHNLAALGAAVSVIGVVGAGGDGQRILDIFAGLGVDASGVVSDPRRPTTRKTRIIASNQQVLRIDREICSEVSETIRHMLENAVRDRMSHCHAVLISDYAKGLFSPAFIGHVVAEAKRLGLPVIADPKGREFLRYAGVTAITPNQKEASEASGIRISDETSLVRAAEILMGQVGCAQVLITRGAEGMVLVEKNDRPFYIRALARQVYDVSGAGDTVLAVFGLAIAAGADTRRAAELANTAAGIVVGKVGTATVSRQELQSAVYAAENGVCRKVKRLEELCGEIEQLRNLGKRIVMTNGCFDLLHAGHIHLFSESKRLGDILVVAIDDDRSVTRLKGSGRPIIEEKNRVRILSALDSVDYVTVFSTDQLKDFLGAIRPDILTKGSNYSESEIVGKEVVLGYGGKVVRIPVQEDISASRIIDAIKNGG
jgi:D-beta-D-heptose 7-phosphate kinase/D-beta-D-heptose 1-phosphate adenosyltransferase